MQEQEDRPGLLREWRDRVRRKLRQWRGTEPRTRVQLRCDWVEHGDWALCPMTIRPGDVVYAIGRGGDLHLERTLLQRYNARVYIFDPDPDTAARADRAGLLDVFQLYAVRVGPENRAAAPDAGPDGARMVRLSDLMQMLGHRRLDLLKVDLDTADEILSHVADEGIDVGQLLVRFPTVGTEADRDRVEALVSALSSRGYRIFRISPDGTRYAFLRADVEAA